MAIRVPGGAEYHSESQNWTNYKASKLIMRLP